MIFYLTLILSCQLAGEVIVKAVGLPLPGPVLGMVILFCGLMLRGLPAGLSRVGDALLGNLSLLFVPAGVGVMLHAGLLGREWLPLAVALVLSTLITVAVTGLVMARLSRGGADD
ncbi:CidA/LrgA family protein [Limibaculum sp. M0105]|uniref:CidA/LrgA family protein n=1 Tax=Thermohalobaculum xanthum TaxID=2753746 RepID=A0A8J7M965_9RHOB|nr:CidA/LrgA family protein [Thermohalobaculum xanthum]MBK0400038.1 CidA/LrgA family protein [Thermohalobaculum xanthum]